jgi:hypothetical protein
MESIFGIENMGKDESHLRMNRAYEKEFLDAARVSNLLRQASRIRPAWYGPILALLGDFLVTSGMRLKSCYSIQHAYKAR